MKKERLFQILGMVEDDFIKEAEEEKNIRRTLSGKTAAWKWAAAAAGILLAVGLRVSKEFLMGNVSNTSSMKDMEEGMLENIPEDAGTLETAAQTFAAASDNTTGVSGAGMGRAECSSAGENVEEQANDELSDLFYEDKMVLYLEIIKETYTTYEGKNLYLDLEKVLNLTEEQKESLMDILAVQYGIKVAGRDFEERSSQEVQSKETAEEKEMYLSLEVTKENENDFSFTVSVWMGNDIEKKDYFAEYSQDGWSYKIDSGSIE